VKARSALLHVVVPALLGLTSVTPTVAWSGEALTIDDVVRAYEAAGMQVTKPVSTANRVAAFSVVGDGRIAQPAVRGIVFSSAEAARLEHGRAHAREEAIRNRELQYSDDAGPQLLSGYGLSFWRGNVALVQIAPVDDVAAHAQEIECTPEVTVRAPPLPLTMVSASYRSPIENLLGDVVPPS
jgi:hypothetical protein